MGAEHRSKCCNTKIDLRKKGSSINCIKQREITAISMTKIIVIWSWGGGIIGKIHGKKFWESQNNLVISRSS